MILNDLQIITLARRGVIAPFAAELVRRTDYAVISYGLSSFGYDLRLSPRSFMVFRHIPGTVLDPKCFNPGNLEKTSLHTDYRGRFFVLPARSYGLGVAVERLNLPDDILVLCIGKSTYARCGIIANVTPAEPGWHGHLTLEFSNASAADCRIYADEGIVQLLFFRGEPCRVSYRKRQGKYQGQSKRVTLAKV